MQDEAAANPLHAVVAFLLANPNTRELERTMALLNRQCARTTIVANLYNELLLESTRTATTTGGSGLERYQLGFLSHVCKADAAATVRAASLEIKTLY
jgi:hypothetical protein